MKIGSKKLVVLILALVVLLGGIYTIKHPKTPLIEAEQGYIVKGNKVYYRTTMDVSDGNDGYHTVVNDNEMKEADAKTFSLIDPNWAKDKGNLFYMGQTVRPLSSTSSIDFSSFTIIKDIQGLGKDNHVVYLAFPNGEGWFYKVIPEADPATFASVQGGPYAKDKKNVYYLDLPFEVRKIEGADGSTFAVLGQCAAVEVSRAYYAWDAKSVIGGDKIISGADRDTFKIAANFDNGPDGMYVAGTYAVDKNHVYKNCGEITKGNPATCSSNNLKACE